MMTSNVVSVNLDDLKNMKGVSTKCFTYNSKEKVFTIEMSELGFLEGNDFMLDGKLCRSNGKINMNTKCRYGSIVLTSHRTGVKAYFTFDREDRDAENELLGVYYKYFAADNDPNGYNSIMHFVKLYLIND